MPDTDYRVNGREVGRAIDEMDMAGGAERTLYDGPDPAVWDSRPAWSPDGTQIVYSSGPDDLHEDIYVMNADGTNPRQLTTYPGRDESPDWGVAPHPLAAGGSVPATLAVTLGGPVQLGPLEPGVAKTYTAATTATVTSTAGDATLTASPTGRLANAAHTLAQPLQLIGVPHSWDGPVSHDAVPVGFAQPIGATEPLRTGAYTTTVVFSLSTTAP
jgi:hypothetical protein